MESGAIESEAVAGDADDVVDVDEHDGLLFVAEHKRRECTHGVLGDVEEQEQVRFVARRQPAAVEAPGPEVGDRGDCEVAEERDVEEVQDVVRERRSELLLDFREHRADLPYDSVGYRHEDRCVYHIRHHVRAILAKIV
eukprot:CAMPEP_0197516476 /NCGR_PEP_ID=MMETSP1318-20131121/1345_1 /TAXON_ID=552666 /ORGANISM="Partenskyella glossopodia, Strain RCC365" /LENGTH=138 /DNA_ID=CAMNT_0043065233 /DNA_START=651 /DNA_END=1067 /DNA_ORIENTATION=-